MVVRPHEVLTESAGQRYWNRHAQNYDRSMRLFGGPMPRVSALIEASVAGAGDVLEVAAGTGLLTTRIAPRVGRLVATDYAQAMVERVERRAHEAGLRNVEVTRADLYALPFAERSFDVVVAGNVLHLVP